MNFDLIKPCKNCPFTTSCLPGWLGEDRAREIVEGITTEQKTFACHKTTEFVEDEEGNEVCQPHPGEQHCAGALILLEKIKRPNQMMRIAERLGYYNRFKLKMDASVFDTPEDFITHHGKDK